MIDIENYSTPLGYMRLREILHLLKENKNNLKLEANGIPSNSLIKYTKVRDYIASIKKIKSIEVFEVYCNKILSIEEFNLSISDELLLSQSAHNQISQTNSLLLSEMDILEKVLDNLLIKQEPETISIKFPELANLEDLLDFISELHNIVLRPLTLFGEQVKVQNFDIGSHWLEILFYSSAGYKLFKSIITASFDIYIEKIKKQNAIDNLKNQLDVPINILQELSKNLSDTLTILSKEKVKFVSQSEPVKDLIKSKNKTENEFREIEASLYMAIDKTVTLVEKKMEIQLALSSPSEDKSSFPDFSKKLELLKQEKIEDKTE